MQLNLFSCGSVLFLKRLRGKYFDMFTGKEEFLTKTHELRMQLDERSKKIHAWRDQKSGILGQVGDRVAESGGFDPCLFLNEQVGVLK